MIARVQAKARACVCVCMCAPTFAHVCGRCIACAQVSACERVTMLMCAGLLECACVYACAHRKHVCKREGRGDNPKQSPTRRQVRMRTNNPSKCRKAQCRTLSKGYNGRLIAVCETRSGRVFARPPPPPKVRKMTHAAEACNHTNSNRCMRTLSLKCDNTRIHT